MSVGIGLRNASLSFGYTKRQERNRQEFFDGLTKEARVSSSAVMQDRNEEAMELRGKEKDPERKGLLYDPKYIKMTPGHVGEIAKEKVNEKYFGAKHFPMLNDIKPLKVDQSLPKEYREDARDALLQEVTFNEIHEKRDKGDKELVNELDVWKVATNICGLDKKN